MMYRRSIALETTVDARRLAGHLATCLRDVDARNVTVDGGRVQFHGGVFRMVSNWNVLVPFGSGELEVDVGRSRVLGKRRRGDLV